MYDDREVRVEWNTKLERGIIEGSVTQRKGTWIFASNKKKWKALELLFFIVKREKKLLLGKTFVIKTLSESFFLHDMLFRVCLEKLGNFSYLRWGNSEFLIPQEPISIASNMYGNISVFIRLDVCAQLYKSVCDSPQFQWTIKLFSFRVLQRILLMQCDTH